MNCYLVNDVLLVSKTLLGYEETLWSKKLEISHSSQVLTNDRQILILSKLSNLYCSSKEHTGCNGFHETTKTI